MMGYLAEQDNFDPQTLKEAMAYGILVASFNVEDFQPRSDEANRARRSRAADGRISQDAELLRVADAGRGSRARDEEFRLSRPSPRNPRPFHIAMPPLRTFIAAEISPEIRTSALRLIERLRTAPVKVTWTKPENLHYTIKFLGDVPAEKTADVCRAVQVAVGPFTPFEIVAAGAGAFPSHSHPRTIWLGMGEGAEPLELVYQAVERVLEPLGFPREHRKFTAHLTLGRVRDGSAERPARPGRTAEKTRRFRCRRDDAR